MKILKGNKICQLQDIIYKISEFKSISIDIGTGDGKFVYKLAQKYPETFFIGIDSTAENMVNYSSRSNKKPSRGGVENLLYVVANVEDLPNQLDGLANNIYINLPWGSLLFCIATGNKSVLDNIVRISRPPQAEIEMLFTYSILHELGEIERRKLPMLSIEYIKEYLSPLYEAKGIKLIEIKLLDNESLKRLNTQWSKRLAFGRSRDIYYVRGIISR